MNENPLFFNQYTPAIPLEPSSPKAAQSPARVTVKRGTVESFVYQFSSSLSP
jgi:hypothetical protein